MNCSKQGLVERYDSLPDFREKFGRQIANKNIEKHEKLPEDERLEGFQMKPPGKNWMIRYPGSFVTLLIDICRIGQEKKIVSQQILTMEKTDS